jgi:hypothetical protein
MKRNTHWQLEDDSDPDRSLKFGPMKRMKRGGPVSTVKNFVPCGATGTHRSSLGSANANVVYKKPTSEQAFPVYVRVDH